MNRLIMGDLCSYFKNRYFFRNALPTLLFMGGMLFTQPQNSHAFSVDLTVAERADVNRPSAPITYGVPLAKSDNITSINTLGLFDGQVELDAQFRVMSRFGGIPTDTTKPIRVVLCDTQSSLTTSQTKVLTLQNTGSGNAAGILSTETANTITVDTGAAIFTFTKTGNFNLFETVSVGGTPTVTSRTNNGAEIEVDGTIFASYNSPADIVEIEENGPLRTVVKARGFFRDTSSSKLFPPLGDTGVEYECRIVLYRNKSYARVYFTLMSENFGWAIKATNPNHSIEFNWLRIRTTLETNTSKTVKFDGYTSGTFATGTYSVVQAHAENGQNESANFSYSIKNGVTEQASGLRYNAYVDLRDTNLGLMVANRWFWQTWPKAIEANDNDILFYLWPDETSDYTFLGGNYKTHEMLYYFHGKIDEAYDFGPELAHLKKRAVLLATDEHYANTQFIDFMPPVGITSDYVFPGGEKLQAAIDTWENTVQAKYNGNLATTIYNSDFDQIREARPLIWDGGVHDDKYMNWYGWQAFGDMWRFGTYGSGALHYNWDYISLIHGLRFNNHTMLEVGEQMVLHHSDRAVTHDPTGVDPTGGSFTELWFRGGGRHEADSQMERGNYQYSTSGANDPRHGAHTWLKGIILQYMLTGNGVYLNSINQSAAHWMHNFKENGLEGTDCSKGSCWSTPESRQVHRVIQMVSDIWKLTGESKYLSLVNDIVNNSLLLNLEAKVNDVPQGYFYYNSKVSSCCGSTCNAHPFYDGISIKPLINAYFELRDYGYTATANAVKDHMLRKAKWYRDELFTNYWLADCGTYGTGDNNGKYFPYQIRTSWKKDCEWNDTTNNGVGYNVYALYAADAFAFVYETTGDPNWINLARSVFKDEWLYLSHEKFQPVNTNTLGRVNGLDPTPSNAWMKAGSKMEKPMYYLNLEWRLSFGLPIIKLMTKPEPVK